MRQININKHILRNGLRLITAQNESDLFSIEVGIRAGSLYEDASNSGISHMIEHMLFKGTSSRDIEKLNNDMEKLAGDIDIYTTYHETVLTAGVMKDKAKDCLEIICDILMKSIFPPKELSLEKNVIVEEIKMTKDDLEDYSYLGLYKTAFPDSWHKYMIAGSIKSVRSIKRQSLYDFYKSYYVPKNTVICIASSYPDSTILEMIENYFGEWEGGDRKEIPCADYSILPQKVVRHKKGIEQAHILYGFDIHNLNRREQVALAVLNKKIGSSANSVLFREMRDKKGYAYNVYSDMDLIKGIGMFYIYAAVSRENLKNSTDLIDDIVSRFSKGLIEIDDESIKTIREMFQTDTASSMESPTHIVDYLLDGEMGYGNPLEYQNILKIMESINAEDVYNVASKFLKNPVIHILQPY